MRSYRQTGSLAVTRAVVTMDLRFYGDLNTIGTGSMCRTVTVGGLDIVRAWTLRLVEEGDHHCPPPPRVFLCVLVIIILSTTLWRRPARYCYKIYISSGSAPDLKITQQRGAW